MRRYGLGSAYCPAGNTATRVRYCPAGNTRTSLGSAYCPAGQYGYARALLPCGQYAHVIELRLLPCRAIRLRCAAIPHFQRFLIAHPELMFGNPYGVHFRCAFRSPGSRLRRQPSQQSPSPTGRGIIGAGTKKSPYAMHKSFIIAGTGFEPMTFGL